METVRHRFPGRPFPIRLLSADAFQPSDNRHLPQTSLHRSQDDVPFQGDRYRLLSSVWENVGLSYSQRLYTVHW